jgi:hypothetical protein
MPPQKSSKKKLREGQICPSLQNNGDGQTEGANLPTGIKGGFP